ncbi:MAG: A/G-specific adenine glycosylase [bacterium]|nr:A/G-specific adenine glycosylase [bacterium]
MTLHHSLPHPPPKLFPSTDTLLRILCSQRPFYPTHVAAFRRIVLRFYRAAARDLPWRRSHSPYHVLVSEIMLQQTHVNRVIHFFPRFIAAFPDFHTLARAPLHRILRLWNGLGYNRRALALKHIAQIVLSHYHGNLPSSPSLLARLPGIGHATASSIAAFAFNLPTLFLETNIRSVFIHYFFPLHKKVHDCQLLPLLKLTLDRKHPRRWYNALMDLGATIKNHYPNPSRRSLSYRTQSPFHGSPRQLRAAILRTLLTSPASLASLAKACNTSPHSLYPILHSLQLDGLVSFSRGRFFIP